MDQEASEPQQPFAGINVVEFGQFVAVPYAGQLLAEGGAYVIKVEALEGDPTRRLRPIVPGETRIYISRNRGKHSLPLALSHPDAKPVIDALLEWADVALMNFRPGAAERLGLDPPTLAERFPRLIVGTVTPFGKVGPDADYAGMDIVVQARSGLMAANGRIVDGRPAAGDPPIADYMCAMSLAFGVSAALLRRERTGLGGSVDTTLMQAAMTLANNQLIRAERHDGPKFREVLRTLSEQRAAGVPYEEQFENVPSSRAAAMNKVYFRTYDTADAVIAVGCGSHSLRLRFMETIGLDDPGLEVADEASLGEHYEQLADRVEQVLRERPSEYWIDALHGAGVPVSLVKFPIELFDDPQAEANDMFNVLDHPIVGPIKTMSPPVVMDGDGFRPGGPTATLGTETDSLLGDLGFSEAQIDELVAAGISRRA